MEVYSVHNQNPKWAKVNLWSRRCVGVVLIVAAASKLLDPTHFAQRISEFGIVFDSLVQPTAWAIIVAELFTGIALICNWPKSLAAAIAIFLLFIGVLVYGILLGFDIDCGCFGAAIRVSLQTQLLVDFGLLVLCAMIYFSERRKLEANHQADSTQPEENKSL